MRHLKTLPGLAMAALVAGCGGGGGDAPAPASGTPTVAGLYFGTTAAAGGTFDALVLDSGRIYGMLGVSAGSLDTIFIGTGTVTASGFTSAAGGNLDTHSGLMSQPAAITLTGTPKASISGSFTGTGSGVPATFNSSYRSSFEGTATLANLAGTYGGNSVGLGRGVLLTIVIGADGRFAGTSVEPCLHTGTFVPNAGANVYDVTVTFGAGCPKAGSMTGHAVWQAATASLPATLTVLASNSDFSDGWLFFGPKAP